MDWISAECGVRCEWSVAKKTGSMHPCRRWSLNTCYDVACPTSQLPYITTGCFQGHQWQPKTSSFQRHQHLNEWNKPSVRWKKLCILQVSVVTFSGGWASGFVFFWDNVNNQKYVRIILLKMTFCTSQGKVATSNMWDGQICKKCVSYFVRI